jgi:hypothetical protein
MRDNWLSNRVFTSYANIVDHCCYAWNKLVDQPCLISPSELVSGQTSHAHKDLV